VDQRAVLANFHLRGAVGDAVDGCALMLILQRLFSEDLHASDLRTGQHRVVEVDLTALQHRLMTGEGALRIGFQVRGAGTVVLPGLHLPTAHDPVAGIEPDFGVG